MRDYYADFLQTKISVDTLPSEVSKVSKGRDTIKKHTFDTFDTALPYVYQKNNYPKNNDQLAELKTDYFHAELNRFIENGVAFDVSTDDFQTIDSNQTLKKSDIEFLELNYTIVLCYLQQSLLMKHLFNHSPDQFEDFAFEIQEREAIFLEVSTNSPLTKADKTPFEIYFAVVKEVTKRWYADLLEKREGSLK
jgi:hypothetical protein